MLSLVDDYREILPGLYQGPFPYPYAHPEFHDMFDCVVVCSSPKYMSLWVQAYPQLQAAVVASFDYSPAGIRKLVEQAIDVASAHRNGARVVVVCNSGVYRSSLFVALVKTQMGVDLDTALADMVATQSEWSVGSAKIFADTVRSYLQGVGNDSQGEDRISHAEGTE